MPTPRQWFRDALNDFRANRTGNQRREQIRADVAQMVEAAQDWLARTDVQGNGAKDAFVEDRAAQFRTFLDALPQVDPTQEP
jgi:hypothetical protein